MKMKNKLLFLGLFLLIVVLSLTSVKAQSTGSYVLLNPRSQPQFVNSLPSPRKIEASNGGIFTLEMKQSRQWLGLYGGAGKDGEYGTSDDERLNTNIWGYGVAGDKVSYPGPTFVAQESVPIEVEWQNKLPREHLLPIDLEKLHSQPLREALEEKLIPAVVHLHGGHTESASDGLPEAWYTQNYEKTGPDWVKKINTYENSQEAGTLWYHDHTNMITSLNVYTGLTGFYLLRDNNENSLIKNNILPSGDYEKELVIQDKSFTVEGELFYPEEKNTTPPGMPNRTGAYGDFILVNGMAWPKLEVEPRKYRLRLLNGSDSRFYKLGFYDSQKKIYLIGSDQGFVENPIALDNLTLSPSERADIIVDFTKDAGKELILRNYGPGADPDTTGQIIKFTVNQPMANVPIATVDTDESDGLSTRLRLDNITPLTPSVPDRQVVLFQLRESDNDDLFLLGTLKDGSFKHSQPITEITPINGTEVWEIYNTTQYTHTVHIHLIGFQVVNRQKFRGNVVSETEPKKGEVKQFLRNVNFQGNPQEPEIYEGGKKDSIIVYPNQVVRVIAKYDRPGKYVWHCHLLIHEDYDMMRPMEVVE